jgi:hypothetical protein
MTTTKCGACIHAFRCNSAACNKDNTHFGSIFPCFFSSVLLVATCCAIQDPPHVWKFNPYNAQGYVPVPSEMVQFATQSSNINRVCRFTLPLGNVVRDWRSHPKHFAQTYMANWISKYSAVADSLAPYQHLEASCITGNPADNTEYRIMAPAQAGGTHMMCRTILNKLEDSLLFYFMVPQDVRETMSCAICNRQIPPALGS